MRIFRCYCYGGLAFDGTGSFSFKIEEEGKTICECSEDFDEDTTHVRMSMESVIRCLEELMSFGCRPEDHVIVHTNYNVVYEAFANRWVDKWRENNWKASNKKKVANIDLWEDLNEYDQSYNLRFRFLKKRDIFIHKLRKEARRSASKQCSYIKG